MMLPMIASPIVTGIWSATISIAKHNQALRAFQTVRESPRLGRARPRGVARRRRADSPTHASLHFAVSFHCYNPRVDEFRCPRKNPGSTRDDGLFDAVRRPRLVGAVPEWHA